MRNWFNTFRPPQLVRIVDAGRLFCPTQQRDIDVDMCLTCRFLDEAVPANNRISEIHCTPSYRALTEHAEV
jgi:hypothetical protein